MALNISDTQRVTVWTIEDRQKFAIVQMSSSRKDKKTDEWKNTSWSFVRFVGKAYEKINEIGLKREDRIVLKGATISQEPYMDNGEKKYPKMPQITVFNWEPYTPEGNSFSKSNADIPPVIEEDASNEEFPF